MKRQLFFHLTKSFPLRYRVSRIDLIKTKLNVRETFERYINPYLGKINPIKTEYYFIQ